MQKTQQISLAGTTSTEAKATTGSSNGLAIAISVPVAICMAILAIALYFLLRPAPETTVATTAFSCSSDGDCLNGGDCSVQTNKCQCAGSWTGDQCSIYAPVASQENISQQCSRVAVPCYDDSDCEGCTATTDTAYVCETLEADENTFGESGTFCLPAKPDNQCADAPCDPAEQESGSCDTMPGQYYWTGWQDVNTMAWNCNCEFTNLYPQNHSTGRCTKSSELCRYGEWQYPCVPDPDNADACVEPNVSQVGANPLSNGRCTCANVACTNDTDCLSSCLLCEGRDCSSDVDCLQWCSDGASCDSVTKTCTGTARSGVYGQCLGQKTSLNTNGTPTCTLDNCYISCRQQPCTTDSNCSKVCKNGTYSCVDGVCVGEDLPLSQQGTWAPDNLLIPPNVYGICSCPTGCFSTNDSCLC